MREHVIKPVTTWQVTEILNVAYRKAASVPNVASGRQVYMWSLTIDVFQDSDFAAATVTNVITKAAHEHISTYVTSDPSCCSSSTDTAVAMVTTQEHNPTPPLTPAVQHQH